MPASKKVVIDTEDIGLARFISTRFGVALEEAESFLSEIHYLSVTGLLDGLDPSVIETIGDLTLGDASEEEVLEGNITDALDLLNLDAIHIMPWPDNMGTKPFKIGFNKS